MLIFVIQIARKRLTNVEEGNYTVEPNIGPNFQLKYRSLPIFIIRFISVILHSLLLTAFFKDPLKCFKNFGTILVITLAMSDFLMCLISPFLLCVRVTSWLVSFKFPTYFVMNVSVVTMYWISIDRFLLVAYPLRHHYLMKNRKMEKWPSCIWLVNAFYP